MYETFLGSMPHIFFQCTEDEKVPELNETQIIEQVGESIGADIERIPPDKVENRPLLIYRCEYARSIEHVVLHIPTCFVPLNTFIEKKLWVDYFLYVIYDHFQLDSHALLYNLVYSINW